MRQTLRRLAQSPGFTALAVFTLAIGIASTTAIFSVVHDVLLEPLPHPDPDRLVLMKHRAPEYELHDMPQCEALYLRYREHNRLFDDVALVVPAEVTLSRAGDPERLAAARVTPSFFPTLKVAPALGRTFDDAEARQGGPWAAILSDAFWRRHFAADPAVLGRTLVLEGVAREIVGVLPPFELEFLKRGIDVWLPYRIDPARTDLGNFNMLGIGRLARGVTLAEAEADLNRLIVNLEEAFPGNDDAAILVEGGLAAWLQPMRDAVVGHVEARLRILFGAVAGVLLIACANVANLLLARAESRRREIAVRTALGARSWQLAASSLAESLTLSLGAGVLGWAGAVLLVRGLVLFGPPDLPRLHEVGADVTTALFCAGVSLATGVVFGLLGVRVREIGAVLKGAGRGLSTTRDRHLSRRLLVSVQVALALVLLIGSGLLVRSFQHLCAVDPGFRADGVLTAELSLPGSAYPDDPAAVEFLTRLLERLRTLPGVDSAGALSRMPLTTRGFSRSGYVIEEHPRDAAQNPVLFETFVDPDALGTLGVPLLEGRPLEPRDQQQRTGAVLVSESVARRFLGGSALGKRLTHDAASGGDPWLTVVGVVGDVRSEALTEPGAEMVYLPLLGKNEDVNAWRAHALTLVVRGREGRVVPADSLRRALSELDANLPLGRVRTLEDVVSQARAPMAFTLVMLLVAAGVSLVLGLVGTFGVVSYLVSQRTSEIGIRMALGARPANVHRMVMSEGLVLAGLGGAVGLVAAFAVTRWLGALLFEVAPRDPLTFVCVPLGLVAVILLACWSPALRAARIEPVVALRHD